MTILDDDNLSDIVEDPTKGPSISGEESPSGDATSSEAMDIDKALGDVGLAGDTDEGPHELDVEDELEEEL